MAKVTMDHRITALRLVSLISFVGDPADQVCRKATLLAAWLAQNEGKSHLARDVLSEVVIKSYQGEDPEVVLSRANVLLDFIVGEGAPAELEPA